MSVWTCFRPKKNNGRNDSVALGTMTSGDAIACGVTGRIPGFGLGIVATNSGARLIHPVPLQPVKGPQLFYLVCSRLAISDFSNSSGTNGESRTMFILSSMSLCMAAWLWSQPQLPGQSRFSKCLKQGLVGSRGLTAL